MFTRFQSTKISNRLFIAENKLDYYRLDPTIIKILAGVQLLNYGEFIGSFGPDALQRFKKICTFNGEFFDELLEQLKTRDTFDLLAAVNHNGEILGFIICQLGEYDNAHTAYSVRLICTTESFKAMILLQAYLFCIINSSFQKIGILQLSEAYTNISGFITYTRCGFRKDLRFVSRNLYLLPMSVDLSSVIEFSLMITIRRRLLADGTGDATVDDDESGIYNCILYKIEPSVLQELIVNNNLLLMLQIVEKLYVLSIGPFELPNVFNGLVDSQTIARDLRRFLSESSHKEEVILFESIFTYLEKTGQTISIANIKSILSTKIQEIKDSAIQQYLGHSSGHTSSHHVGGKIKKRTSKVKKTKRKTKHKTRNRFSK
jgi:hypothetical protein